MSVGTNDWLTPPEIIEALGPFDLDPCCPNGMPWKTARRMVTKKTDGLSIDWKGRVWLNPPYGHGPREWLHRLADHGNGIALVPSRTDGESWFWPCVWERADAVFFFRGRLHFRDLTGVGSDRARHGSILAAYGQRNIEAIDNSGLKGRLIHLKAPP